MINIFRRLTAKEWGMIALSTVFICLAVWMDLKTPEYLSDRWQFLWAFWLQESLPALRRDFEERFSIK